jgi:hypothetical protein
MDSIGSLNYFSGEAEEEFERQHREYEANISALTSELIGSGMCRYEAEKLAGEYAWNLTSW